MLRVSLVRPLVLRQFSTSSTIWNSSRSKEPLKNGENQTGPPPQEPQAPTTPETTNSHETSNSTTDRPNSFDSLAPYDLEVVKRRIREWTGQAAITVRTRADDFTAHTKTTFSQLGSQLNKVTGYEVIEALKRDVVEQEARINATRQAARQAKVEYDEAVVQRSNSQREVNDLLQRKSNWNDEDVSRFTTLVRQDHLFEQEEVRAKAAVDETEAAVEREFSKLMRTILARYHEEQVWSDKIRSASTYGSLAALGLNMLVFVMAIVVVEPWKRRRLAQTFEKKIEELSLENAARLEASMTEIGKQLAGQERLLVQTAQALSQPAVVEPTEAAEELNTVVEDNEPPQATTSVAARNQWELAAVATSAFLVGAIGCLWIK